MPQPNDRSTRRRKSDQIAKVSIGRKAGPGQKRQGDDGQPAPVVVPPPTTGPDRRHDRGRGERDRSPGRQNEGNACGAPLKREERRRESPTDKRPSSQNPGHGPRRSAQNP